MDQDDREDRVRKTDQIVSRAIELWPLWLTLAGGVVTAVNFYQNVKDLSEKQKSWQATSDARRDANRKEFEDINTRLTIIETKLAIEKR